SSPGCSPTSMSGACGSPAPNTVLVARCQRGQARQSAAATRRAAIVGGVRSLTPIVTGPSLFRRTGHAAEGDVAANRQRRQAPGARAPIDGLLQRRERGRGLRTALVVLHRLGDRSGAVVEG